MNRRKALKNVALLLGTAISAGTTDVLFSSYKIPETEKNSVTFTAEHLKALTEVADIIIPTTKSSPGAKAAHIGEFIPMMVTDCYPAKSQQSFYNGLLEFETRAKKSYGKSFALLPLVERKKMLTDLRLETLEQRKTETPEKRDIAYFFTVVRDLTILGYFSSEIGCTQAREYLPIPGSYDGAYPLKPEQRSWAT